jgi:murein DD-endopeptidase MepM/ murein hydrolase activator NlpD
MGRRSMATGSSARGARFDAQARGAVRAVVLGLLLLCAGCGSRPAPLPLMADTLLLRPVDQGRLSAAYGVRQHPILKRRMMHRGVDWAAPRGTPVRAAGDGLVSALGPLGAYGRYLRLEHGGTVATAYAHLERYAPHLRPGHLVRQGDLIGYVGSSGRATGPHLHYELLIAGRQIDPLALAPAVAEVPAMADSGLGIGGPDLEPELADAAPPAPRQVRSVAAPTDPASMVIRVEDLLRLRP